MKITSKQLKQLIKESVEEIIQEINLKQAALVGACALGSGAGCDSLPSIPNVNSTIGGYNVSITPTTSPRTSPTAINVRRGGQHRRGSLTGPRSRHTTNDDLPDLPNFERRYDEIRAQIALGHTDRALRLIRNAENIYRVDAVPIAGRENDMAYVDMQQTAEDAMNRLNDLRTEINQAR
jgi:hypothetical protein